MAEVNQCAPGLYALQSDYTALERKCQELERERDSAQAELARLRAVEKAAKAMIEAGLADIDDAERAYDALAEACGRKP